MRAGFRNRAFYFTHQYLSLVYKRLIHYAGCMAADAPCLAALGMHQACCGAVLAGT
jgi:hypothetical protein